MFGLVGAGLVASPMLLNDAIAVLLKWGPSAKVSPEIRFAKKHPTLGEAANREHLGLAQKARLFAYQSLVEIVEANPESTKTFWLQFHTRMGNTFPWLTCSSLRHLYFEASYGAYKDGILSGSLTAPRRSLLQWIKAIVK